jgi:uncharacterized protein
MKINVSQQLKGPLGAIRKYKVSEPVNIGDVENPAEGEIKLIRTNRGILAKGNLNTRIDLTCSRCLGSFSYPLALDIEEECFPTRDVVSGVPLSVPDEPGCITIDENNVLDLAEPIRQYAALITPMKPLCREDCAGLCPSCGRNLNSGNCSCPPQPADPRWAKLSQLVLVESQTSTNEQKGKN